MFPQRWDRCVDREARSSHAQHPGRPQSVCASWHRSLFPRSFSMHQASDSAMHRPSLKGSFVPDPHDRNAADTLVSTIPYASWELEGCCPPCATCQSSLSPWERGRPRPLSFSISLHIRPTWPLARPADETSALPASASSSPRYISPAPTRMSSVFCFGGIGVVTLSVSGLPVGGIQLVVEGLLHEFDVRLVPVRVNVRVGSSFLELGVLFAKIKEFSVRTKEDVTREGFEQANRLPVVFN